MAMWVRLGGALLITLLVLACLEYFGVSAILGGRAADDVQHDVESRLRELFWLAIFSVVMVMSVVAAVRRWAALLRGALVAPPLGRRHVS
jgi:purine-cytosine permease-like protein